MVLLQLLGTNAAGKSATLRALAAVDPHALVVDTVTALPTLGVVLVGDYLAPTKTPGADRISPNTRLFAALDDAVTRAEAAGYWAVAWEGIILQTKTWHPVYVARGLCPAYGVLAVPDSVAFERIEGRSGKRREDLSGNGKIILGRSRTVRNLARWLRGQPGAVVEELDWRLTLEDLAARAVALMQRRTGAPEGRGVPYTKGVTAAPRAGGDRAAGGAAITIEERPGRMASKAAVSRELKELRIAYGMNPEEFAASLSTHLGTVLIPPAQLLRWEAGKGPSSRYRTLLAPVLKVFRDHLSGQDTPTTAPKPVEAQPNG